jgi:hypothetical protein
VSAAVDWSVCKTEEANRLDLRTTQWAIAEQKETLVLLAMRRLSVMERMVRYKTLTDATAMQMQQDFGDNPGSVEILKIKTKLHEMVFQSMEELGGAPTTSWQYYEVSRLDDPALFARLTMAAQMENEYAYVDVPLAKGSRYRHIMVLDQQVQAFVLPSPQNVGNMLVTIKKGPSSIIVPKGSAAQPETWLHPDISAKRGYSFNYDSDTCKPLTQPCTRACKESFAPVSPFGPWMLRIVPEDTDVNVTSMFANVDRLRMAFQIRYYIDDTGGEDRDTRIFDMEESVCGRATCAADGLLGPAANNDCTRSNVCALYPCENGGACSSSAEDEFVCTCTFGFTGDRCTVPVNPCDVGNGGCNVDSTCRYINPGYAICACPLDMVSDGTALDGCRAPQAGECELDAEAGTVDRSDEGANVACLAADFECKNLMQCVPRSRRCDGSPDCLDMSDEDGCNAVDVGESLTGCDANEYMCKDMQSCIPASWRCDGVDECADGSDEIGCDEQAVGASSADSTTRHRTLVALVAVGISVLIALQVFITVRRKSQAEQRTPPGLMTAYHNQAFEMEGAIGSLLNASTEIVPAPVVQPGQPTVQATAAPISLQTIVPATAPVPASEPSAMRRVASAPVPKRPVQPSVVVSPAAPVAATARPRSTVGTASSMARPVVAPRQMFSLADVAKLLAADDSQC